MTRYRASGPALLALLGCTLAVGRGGAADRPAPNEYEVKAAFLYHFSQLTEWPRTGAEDAPFVIGVLGRDPFGEALDRTVAGRRTHGRTIVVRRYAEVAELSVPPPLLFVAASHVGQVAAIQGRLVAAPTLVVSDREEPAASVSFRLTPEGNVRFDVNLHECEARGLRISSEVLKLARIVGTSRS